MTGYLNHHGSISLSISYGTFMKSDDIGKYIQTP